MSLFTPTAMSRMLGELRGINEALANRFKALGLVDADALLDVTRTPEERRRLAQSLAIDKTSLLELANRADMARIKGIGRVYSDLLEEAGVNSVIELSKRAPAILHAQLITINRVRQLTQRPPSAEQIAGFVEQASRLPLLITH